MNKSILSVNGNKAMNFLLKTVLDDKFNFIPSSDVFHGLYHLKTNRTIKVMVVDIDFKPQQGWELIEHIKSSKLYKIPVIVLTTENSDSLREKCYQFQIDELFFKPFNPLDLVAAINTMTNVNIADINRP